LSHLDSLQVFSFQCVYDIGLQRYKDYKIRVCEKHSIMFRCLVAKTDIGAGEIIFKELSLVCSPSPSSPPTCLTCSSPVTGSYPCPNCGWPMCNKKCALNPVHANQVNSSNLPFVNCRVRFRTLWTFYWKITVVNPFSLYKRRVTTHLEIMSRLSLYARGDIDIRLFKLSRYTARSNIISDYHQALISQNAHIMLEKRMIYTLEKKNSAGAVEWAVEI